MPEWLYEEGIGENRAILVEGETILEAAIELPADLRVGSVVAGHVRDLVPERAQAWVSSRDGEILVRNVPKGVGRGRLLRVEVVREEILEPGKSKSLVGRLTDEGARLGPTLAERIGEHRRLTPTDPDLFENAGWYDLIEEAITGDIPFDGGELRLSLTPAMTLFDVDGWLLPAELASRGADAAGRAIRRHGIAGSIGIDLPTVTSRLVRQRAAAALDAALPMPFERTSVNGFGFLQVVRKRERQSLPEMFQSTPVACAARAVLRRAERVRGVGSRKIDASPQVVRFLESRPEWLEQLQRRIGAGVTLTAKTGLTTWAFHVQAVPS